MTTNEKITENILCLIAGILFAVAFIAIMLDGGDRGLLDLF